MASLTQLEYVIAVDQCRHFGRAATLCRVSQPTLSTQLQKLENEIGVVLFDRNRQPILPTEDGAPWIEQAKVVLNEYRRFSAIGSKTSSGVSGKIRLAVIPTVSPYLMPAVLENFHQKFPGIELILEELSTRRIIEALDKDQIDAGILATPLGISRIHEDPLYYEPFFVYIAPNHKLSHAHKISESSLNPDELWLPSEEHCLRDQVIASCGGAGARQSCGFPSIQMQGGSLETVIELVSKGRGYTLLPQLAAQAVSRRKYEGRVIEMSRPAPSREVSLVYRRGHLKLALLNTLKSVILGALPKSLPQEKSKSLRVLDLIGRYH